MSPGPIHGTRGGPFGKEPIALARLVLEVELVVEDADGERVTVADSVLIGAAVRATVARLVDRGLLPADAVTHGEGLVLPNP